MWFYLFKRHCLGNSAAGRQFGHSTLPLGFALLCVKWGWQQRKSREEMEAGAGLQKPMLTLSRHPGCGLHLPGQATSGANRLFFRPICIFGGFTSTKDSLNLLQWPREGCINQQLTKVEACGEEETQNENTAWQWWQGSDKKVNWSILLFTFYKLLSVSLLGLGLTQCLHCDGWWGQEHMSSLCF